MFGIEVLNHREQAMALWVIALVGAALFSKDIRRALRDVLGAFTQLKIALPLVGAAVYAALVVLAAQELGVWSTSSLKETIYWFFGTAVIAFFNSNEAQTDPAYFEKTVRKTLGFTVLLAWVVNVHVFGLVWELALIPAIAFLVLIDSFKEASPEIAKLAPAARGCLIVVGAVVVTLSLASIVTDLARLSVDGLYLPPLLTLAFVPYLYAVALASMYELVFMRIGWRFRKTPERATAMKRETVRFCHLNLSRLRRFSQGYVPKLFPPDRDVEGLLDDFKRQESERAA